MSCWCKGIGYDCTECESSANWTTLSHELKLILLSLKDALDGDDTKESKKILMRLIQEEIKDGKRYSLDLVPKGASL